MLLPFQQKKANLDSGSCTASRTKLAGTSLMNSLIACSLVIFVKVRDSPAISVDIKKQIAKGFGWATLTPKF